MADVYRAHACTEREALERLAAEADLGRDRLSRVRVQFDSSIHRRITLWVPDVVGQPQPPASAVGLDEGLACLLVNGTQPPTAARRGSIARAALHLLPGSAGDGRRHASTSRAVRHPGARRAAAIRRRGAMCG